MELIFSIELVEAITCKCYKKVVPKTLEELTRKHSYRSVSVGYIGYTYAKILAEIGRKNCNVHFLLGLS